MVFQLLALWNGILNWDEFKSFPEDSSTKLLLFFFLFLLKISNCICNKLCLDTTCHTEDVIYIQRYESLCICFTEPAFNG